ncbi:conserved exported hypothetical protein [Planktothrix sp. PCC 11201]|uniref:hypothetical protein n=1 Tax=Planktothrix sp. PCC 11201 TaxID=1729650 RepID=UPI00091D0C8E|nr:hypothetical protein [Planktothrix sp. PCC 11201]SKB12003.1 conserved exported hypothetical protein [Planktothrix sp. PCC 11201]
MKSSHPNRRPQAIPPVNKKQPRPFILALMLTGVLALKADSNLLKSALVHSRAVISDSLTITQKPVSPRPTETQRLWEIPENPIAISPITPTYRVLPNPLFKHQGHLPKTIPVIYAKTPLNPEWAVNVGDRAKVLPPAVDKKIRETIAQESGVIVQDLKIVEARQQTWPDTCLGLAKTDEICGQMLVSGWRVVVSDGRQTWVYRTDAQGRIIRLESQGHSLNLPSSVLESVFKDILQRSGLSPSQLTLEAVEEQIWPDGCLGLVQPGMFCTQSLVAGWRVIVGHENQRWVYRTSQTGSSIQFDRATSSVMPNLRLQFLKISGDDFLSPWTKTLIAHLSTSCQVSNFVNLSIGDTCSN